MDIENTVKFPSEKADIKFYPNEIRNDPSLTITLGDMHGNTMKLLWILVREGAIIMKKEDFNDLWEIYNAILFETQDPNRKELIEFDKKFLKNFTEILEKTTVNSGSKIRLLGDILADRGENDYLTLKVLEKLQKGGVKPEIIFSNHDAYLLSNYKKPISPSDKVPIIPTDPLEIGTQTTGTEWIFFNPHDQQHSMVSLYAYIKLGLIQQKEVQELVETYIIPSLKLISYSLSEDSKTIDLFMHAPNDFYAIKELAKELGVIQDDYKPKSALELAETIDKINVKFQEVLSTEKSNEISYKNILDIVANEDIILDESTNLSILDFSEDTQNLGHLLNNFIWNRIDSGWDIDTPGNIDFDSYPPFVNHIIHGHTNIHHSHNSKQIDLDNSLGKTREHSKNFYLSAHIKETTLANSKQQKTEKRWLEETHHCADETENPADLPRPISPIGT